MNSPNLLVPARPSRTAPNSVAPALPLPPLPREGHDPVIPSERSALPQGDKAAAALGFNFDRNEQIESTNLVPKNGVCPLNPSSNLTKRFLWVYLWFEQTDIAAIAVLTGEIVLTRNGTVIGKFPFGDVFPAANATGQSILNVSWGGAPGVGMGPNPLEVRPSKPTATEPTMSIVSPVEFNAEIDEIHANILKVNSNVSSYRIILACLSTSP